MAVYFDGRYLSSEDSEFVQLVTCDIYNYLKNSEELSSNILLFPPILSYFRFLIHKTVEEFVSLKSFSIGVGDNRKTVVATAELIRKMKNSQKKRHPDMALYVPKARRSGEFLKTNLSNTANTQTNQKENSFSCNKIVKSSEKLHDCKESSEVLCDKSANKASSVYDNNRENRNYKNKESPKLQVTPKYVFNYKVFCSSLCEVKPCPSLKPNFGDISDFNNTLLSSVKTNLESLGKMNNVEDNFNEAVLLDSRYSTIQTKDEFSNGIKSQDPILSTADNKCLVPVNQNCDNFTTNKLLTSKESLSDEFCYETPNRTANINGEKLENRPHQKDRFCELHTASNNVLNEKINCSDFYETMSYEPLKLKCTEYKHESHIFEREHQFDSINGREIIGSSFPCVENNPGYILQTDRHQEKIANLAELLCETSIQGNKSGKTVTTTNVEGDSFEDSINHSMISTSNDDDIYFSPSSPESTGDCKRNKAEDDNKKSLLVNSTNCFMSTKGNLFNEIIGQDQNLLITNCTVPVLKQANDNDHTMKNQLEIPESNHQNYTNDNKKEKSTD